jgi:hypothetical protein
VATTLKTDNATGAHRAKVELRRKALEAVPKPSVFDGFCGLGEMYRAVWHAADSYLGCDARKWSPSETHRRLVCDNRVALRCLDLSQFNVFDFDAYGDPWEQMIIMGSRRDWAKGERGAAVLTDGTSMQVRFGRTSHAMASLLGTTGENLPRAIATGDALGRLLVRRWCARAKVHPVAMWRAEGNGSGMGTQKMVYTALVFEGTGAK